MPVIKMPEGLGEITVKKIKRALAKCEGYTDEELIKCLSNALDDEYNFEVPESDRVLLVPALAKLVALWDGMSAAHTKILGVRELTISNHMLLYLEGKAKEPSRAFRETLNISGDYAVSLQKADSRCAGKMAWDLLACLIDEYDVIYEPIILEPKRILLVTILASTTFCGVILEIIIEELRRKFVIL